VSEAAAAPAADVLSAVGSTPAGLDAAEAGRRLTLVGPNAVRTHHAQPLRILGRQLSSPVLILLAVTASISFVLGQRTDTVVIGVILLASIGLGFVNEYRAERATDALHSQVSHQVVALRGQPVEVDVTALVPGDVVRLALGEVVPADLRLLSTTGLECDESVLTAGYVRVGLLPFDHDRRMTSAVVRAPNGDQQLVVKGAPESVLARCTTIPAEAAATLQAQFAAGSRVVAVAARATTDLTVPTAADESDLTLTGFPGLPGPPQGRCCRLAGSPRRPRHHREGLHR